MGNACGSTLAFELMPIEQLPTYPAELWQYKSLLRSIGKNVHFSDKQHLIKNLKMVHDQYQKKYDFMMDWRIWCDAYEGAQKRLAARQAKLPKIDYPALPISDHADKLCKLIRTNRVVVIAGETGSGKTTQIPKICLQAGQGVQGFIAQTQPRRLAARTIASRLAQELKSNLGEHVGYKVRFSDATSDDVFVKVVTDGILLSELQTDKTLSVYDTIIIDEAHERNLNIDFLLGYIKLLLREREDLKLVISSATIDEKKFSDYFWNAPVVRVSGRTYPVDIFYRPYLEENIEINQRIVDCIKEICSLRIGGDILVFLSGEREIREASRVLGKAFQFNFEVIPLYARLTLSEQDRIFLPHKHRRIVLATNVAETSITVPGITFVIDAGKARISRYSYRSKVQRLQVEAVSRASAEQRAGRCGRVSAGICYRLYSEQDLEGRPEFTDPEILRTNLAAVILRMLYLGLGDIEHFPFISAPDNRMINDGYKLLGELQAITAEKKLTSMGRKLVLLQVDPRFARMLVEASANGSLKELSIIVSALGIQDVRERPLEFQEAADAKHAQWKDKTSDFVTILNLWNSLETHRKLLTKNQFSKYCRNQFLSPVRVKEWYDLVRQIRFTCRSMSMTLNRLPADYRSLHCAILSGLLSHIGVRGEKNEFLGPRTKKFVIFPSSGVAKAPPKWLMVASFLETSRIFAVNVAKIDPSWLLPMVKHLIKSSYSAPFYNNKSGHVMAMRRQILFGLTLVEGEKIHFGKVDPAEAHNVFIQKALVENGYEGPGIFKIKNDSLLKRLEKLEHRTRRRDIVADESAIQTFYSQKIPLSVNNCPDFEKWRIEKEQSDSEFLWMKREHLMLRDVSSEELSQFPDRLLFEGNEYNLHYRFQPGHPDDGVSVVIPIALLHQVPKYYFEWLVPGMLRTKCIRLLKSLPKSLRRKLVPIPDTVDVLLDGVIAQNRPLISFLGDRLNKDFALGVHIADWNLDEIEPWHEMNFILQDVDNQVLAKSRCIISLKKKYRKELRIQIENGDNDFITSDRLVSWDFDFLPERISKKVGKMNIVLWPSLRDRENYVSVELLDNAIEADNCARKGQLRFAMLKGKKIVKFLSKKMLQSNELNFYSAGLDKSGHLVDALIKGAFNEAIFSLEKVIRTRIEFDACYNKGIGNVAQIAEANWGVIESLLPELRKIQTRLSKLCGPSDSLKKDIKYQLFWLFDPVNLQAYSSVNLKQYRRYTQALTLRLEKWPRQSARDQIHSEYLFKLIEPCTCALQVGELSFGSQKKIRDFLWLVEEYRVSLFAQQLGTRVKVSAKRLEREWKLIHCQLEGN